MNPTLDPFTIVVAAIVATLSAARITRLFTQDVYPPVARLRAWWEDRVERSRFDDEWATLATCPYCAGFWVSGLVAGTAWLSVWLTGDIHWTWWVVNSVFALAYAAAMVVVRDGE